MVFRLCLGILLLIFVGSFLVKTFNAKRKRDHDEDNAIAFQNNELEHNQYRQQHGSAHHNHGHAGGDSSHHGDFDGGGHHS